MAVVKLVFACIGLFWYALQWFIGLLGAYVARSRYHGRTDPSTLATLPAESVPGVTILRPLRGLDCNLYENLEASFLQEYPKFEIIFSVADEADHAISIVHDLMAKYPHVKAKLIIGEEIVGVNPKINNLIRPYREAAFDILWVLDSNVLTKTQTLARSVPLLTTPPAPGQRAIGLVHHLPFAIYPDTRLGARIEQTFLCATHAKMYLAINQLKVASCVTGKSCLYRKSDLERAAEGQRAKARHGKGTKLSETGAGDGLAAFGQYLGEDNMIGEAIWNELGMRHAMGSELAGNTVGSMGLQAYFRRRVRWIRVRKYMVAASTLLEPFTESILCGIVGAATFSYWLGTPAIALFAAHMLAWLALDTFIFTSLIPSSPSPSRTHPPHHDGPNNGFLPFLRAWASREALALPIWLFAMAGNTVGWRDNGEVYRVRMDGTVGLVQGDQGWAENLWARISRMWGERTYIRISPDAEDAYARV